MLIHAASPPPLVSVVAIFLDAERFLEEAIESVLAQTHARWELLLVDDGSSDGSSAIARRYAERGPERVRYLEHPGHRNLGMSASRNLGLQHARGAYLALLDADDVWLPGKLARQVELLEAHPEAALLSGAPLYWFGWTGRPEDVARDYVIDLKLAADRIYEAPALLLPFLRRAAPTPCPSDVMVRRECATAVGGFEAHFTGVNMVYEDQAFLSKLLLRYPAFVAGRVGRSVRSATGDSGGHVVFHVRLAGLGLAVRHRCLGDVARSRAAHHARLGRHVMGACESGPHP